MAVIDSKKKWSDTSVEQTSGTTSLVEAWDVTLDGPEMAKLFALTAPGIPAPGSSISTDIGTLTVRTRTAEPVGPFHWTVTITADNEFGGGEILTSPFDDPPQVQGGSFLSTTQIENDINGDPILNTADEPPDPPVTDTIYDPKFRVTWNVPTIPPAFTQSFVNKVNADTFQGAPPGTVLVDLLDWDFVTETRLGVVFEYFRVTAEFVYRQGIPFQAHDGTGGPSRAWWRRTMNKGFREKIGVDGDGKPEYRQITDDEGNPITEPVLLALDGTILDDANEAVFLEFQTKAAINVSALNVPL